MSQEDKDSLMRAEITQQILYLILAGKVAAVATFIAEDEQISPLDALTKFYASSTYKCLEQESTKLWHYGPIPRVSDGRISMPPPRLETEEWP